MTDLLYFIAGIVIGAIGLAARMLWWWHKETSVKK